VSRRYRIGIDVGGTFTTSSGDESGTVTIAKIRLHSG